jgi:hypothetical protein
VPELELCPEPIPGQVPLAVGAAPELWPGVEAAPDELDEEFVVELVELAVEVLALGVVVAEVVVANATEVPMPTRAPLSTTMAIACLVRRFIVPSSLLLVR